MLLGLACGRNMPWHPVEFSVEIFQYIDPLNILDQAQIICRRLISSRLRSRHRDMIGRIYQQLQMLTESLGICHATNQMPRRSVKTPGLPEIVFWTCCHEELLCRYINTAPRHEPLKSAVDPHPPPRACTTPPLCLGSKTNNTETHNLTSPVRQPLYSRLPAIAYRRCLLFAGQITGITIKFTSAASFHLAESLPTMLVWNYSGIRSMIIVWTPQDLSTNFWRLCFGKYSVLSANAKLPGLAVPQVTGPGGCSITKRPFTVLQQCRISAPSSGSPEKVVSVLAMVVVIRCMNQNARNSLFTA